MGAKYCFPIKKTSSGHKVKIGIVPKGWLRLPQGNDRFGGNSLSMLREQKLEPLQWLNIRKMLWNH